MAGVKGKSGRRPLALEKLRLNNNDIIELEANRALRKMKDMNDEDRLDFAIKFVLPIYLKTMTSKQAIVQTSLSLSLNNEQINQLIVLAQRNALIYKDLDSNEETITETGTESESGGGGGVQIL